MDFGKVLDNISEEVKVNVSVHENDYIGDDGLLMCGNCNTPKQVRVSFLGIEKTPFCMCKCEAEKREAEEKERQKVNFEQMVEKNRSIAFPDCDSRDAEDDMRNWTFYNDDQSRPELTRAGLNYVKHFNEFMRSGKGLLLYGTVGTGKSYMAACISNALLDKGYQVLMTSFSRIENTVFGLNDKQEYYDSLNRYHLLVLDDFGAERNSEYMQEIVYNVIDSRWRARLPLIVTSNLTSQQLKSPANITAERIYSRIIEMCHPITVSGTDRRKKKAVQSFAETKMLLGI